MTEVAEPTRRLRFVSVGALLGLVTLAFAVVASEGVHGRLIPSLVLHPWGVIAASIEDGPVAGFIVGALEWPAYSAALYFGRQRSNFASTARILALIHLAGIVIAARMIWGYRAN